MVYFSSPVIMANRILTNTADVGGGILVGGSVRPGAQIVGNTFQQNIGYNLGGGIGLDAAGTVTIEDNTFILNDSQVQGGAIGIVGEADEIIVQNIMEVNSAPSGEEQVA